MGYVCTYAYSHGLVLGFTQVMVGLEMVGAAWEFLWLYVHKCTDFFCDVWCVTNYAVNGHLNVCSTIYFLLKQI